MKKYEWIGCFEGFLRGCLKPIKVHPTHSNPELTTKTNLFIPKNVTLTYRTATSMVKVLIRFNFVEPDFSRIEFCDEQFIKFYLFRLPKRSLNSNEPFLYSVTTSRLATFFIVGSNCLSYAIEAQLSKIKDQFCSRR